MKWYKNAVNHLREKNICYEGLLLSKPFKYFKSVLKEWGGAGVRVSIVWRI